MGKQSRKASKAKGLHAAASPSAGEPDLSALMGALGMGGASGASGQAPGMQQLAQLMQMLQGMEGMGPGDDLPPEFMQLASNGSVKDTTAKAQDAHEDAIAARLAGMMKKQGLEETFMQAFSEGGGQSHLLSPGAKMDGSRLDKVPCAGGDGRQADLTCLEAGVLQCARCKMVAYCSKECQVAHWSLHKRSCCKHPLASEDWKPDYIKSMRPPGFMEGGIDMAMMATLREDKPWGQLPLFGLLGGWREWDRERIDLCWAACDEDIRGVLLTVNQVPETFNGELHLHLNSRSDKGAARQFLMLYLLHTMGHDAIELVIALWYSAAMTSGQHVTVLHQFMKLNDDAGISRKLQDMEPTFAKSGKTDTIQVHIPCTGHKGEGKAGSLDADLEASVWRGSLKLIMQNRDFTLPDFMEIWDKRMKDPRLRDHVDRYLSKLQPAHRVGFQNYSNFGLLYPYGGMNAHLNSTNPFLYEEHSGLGLDGTSNPLDGWDMKEVLRAASSHRVPCNDLFGTLFFYLKDQLGAFVDRLQRHHITISMTSKDPDELARRLKKDSIRFDRIDTSTIADRHHSGLHRVLEDFAPLLRGASEGKGGKKASMRPSATSTPSRLITGFRNWAALTGRDKKLRKAAEALLSKRPKKEPVGDDKSKAMQALQSALSGSPFSLASVDTWPEFQAYLRTDEKVERLCERLGIRMVVQEGEACVVPPRYGVPVGAPMSAVPQVEIVDDEQEDYHLTRLHNTIGLQERFMEFTPAQ